MYCDAVENGIERGDRRAMTFYELFSQAEDADELNDMMKNASAIELVNNHDRIKAIEDAGKKVAAERGWRRSMTNIQNACVLLIRELYKTESAGGDIHIVTDDANVTDDDIEWAAQFIALRKKNETDNGRLELAILSVLRLMTESERLECVEKA